MSSCELGMSRTVLAQQPAAAWAGVGRIVDRWLTANPQVEDFAIEITVSSEYDDLATTSTPPE